MCTLLVNDTQKQIQYIFCAALIASKMKNESKKLCSKWPPTPFALKTFIQPKSKMVDRCVCEVKDISSIVDKYKELHLYLYQCNNDFKDIDGSDLITPHIFENHGQLAFLLIHFAQKFHNGFLPLILKIVDTISKCIMYIYIRYTFFVKSQHS